MYTPKTEDLRLYKSRRDQHRVPTCTVVVYSCTFANQNIVIKLVGV